MTVWCWRSLVTAWTLGLALTGVRADARADCDALPHFRVLAAEAQALPEARAVWLDRQRLQWPGVQPAAAARLLWAARPTLRAPAGQVAEGFDRAWPLVADAEPLPPALADRFRHLAPGARWRLDDPSLTPTQLHELHRGQLWLVTEDAAGRVLQATRLQHAGALDDLYAAAAAADAPPLGVSIDAGGSTWRLWAPSAQAVALCLYRDDRQPAQHLHALQREASTGTWQLTLPGDRSGRFYAFLVDVMVPGHGLVRQRVTDPYAVSLGTDSRRAWVGRLDDPRAMPPGWSRAPRPAPLAAQTDLVVYELHLRDFSIGDPTVPPRHRGRYTAFEHRGSQGMRHLRTLARAGLTDVHLLPVFDIASVPERGCVTPRIPRAAPDALAQAAAVQAVAARDCFNWGYDPLHFNAPEGSYASDAADGAVRIREFRRLVMALHRIGLRVGMDVVYNHTSASGQHEHSVLDRIVPGYYHRLDAAGRVERSTCCDNTATEHAMMGRLLLDSVRLWARHYRIDSFRFDLMGHQPRALMERLRDALHADRGHAVPLIGEGWNFGEVADGARFVQASQRSLAGSGIASFSDRARDALRGGGHGDDGDAMVARLGWLNGSRDPALADLVRLGLAGTLRDVVLPNHDGVDRRGDAMRYAGQPAGYAAAPGEVVNYVENHDNATLWDLNAFKLPPGTPPLSRARVQVLGIAATALSQGVAYFHAGVDLLRSKSMDVNSFDSGDAFNRLDWSGRSNGFGQGLPPGADNERLHAWMAPRLRDPSARASPREIAFARRAMREWLAVRASTRLLRLASTDEVQRRLRFHGQEATLIAAELDGSGLPDAGFAALVYMLNADTVPRRVDWPALAGQRWRLHPALRVSSAGARVDARRGEFTLPPRTAAVWVR